MPAPVLDELEDHPEVQLFVSTNNGFTLGPLAATGVAGTFLNRPWSPARKPKSKGACPTTNRAWQASSLGVSRW